MTGFWLRSSKQNSKLKSPWFHPAKFSLVTLSPSDKHGKLVYSGQIHINLCLTTMVAYQLVRPRSPFLILTETR